MDSHEIAHRELWKHLKWMQGCKQLPSAYLGRNLGEIASDLIRRAYPELGVPGTPIDGGLEPTNHMAGGEAALAIGEHAFLEGWIAALKFAEVDSGIASAMAHDRAWSEYDPPEHIKALS